MGEFLTIRNAFVSHLTTCGPYTAGEISTCDFGILSGVSGCAIVAMPGITTLEEMSFRSNPRNDFRHWGIDGEIYVKDTGDPTGFNARIWQALDDFYTTINKDGTLGGTSDNARLTRLGFVGFGELKDTAGQMFGVVRFNIIADKLT